MRGARPLALAAAALAFAPAAGATTRTIDDDGKGNTASCDAAASAFASFQPAIDASSPGDTLRVCPGIYVNQNVIVAKRLTITGRTAPAYAERCTGYAQSAAVDAIVVPGRARPAPTFLLAADHVTVRGLVLRDNPLAPAIATSSAGRFSGLTVESNLFVRNSIGLALETGAAANTTIAGNCFRANNLGPGGAAGTGYGIRSDVGLHRTTISGNAFAGHASLAVLLEGNPNDRVAVLGNKSQGDAFFLSLAHSTRSRISGNSVRSPISGGIALSGANFGTHVTGNALEDGGGDGILVGALGAPNERLTVTGNLIRRFTGSGIRVTASASLGGTFQRNTASGNIGFGFEIDLGNPDNVFGPNTLGGNLAGPCRGC